MESVEEEREWEVEPIVYVNGVRRVLPDDSAHLTLLQYLRDTGLTGTKLGCGEGGCGACTVMVSFHDQHLKKSQHYAVNACLSPLYSVEGMHVITVEGLGNRQQGLHPVQESLANAHGSQCGYCTPGFIMSMYALLRSSKLRPSEEEIEESLAGNLCRCTGYRPIIDAFRVFAKSYDSLYTESSPKSLRSDTFVCPSSGKPCSCREIGTNNCEDSFSSISGNGKQYFSHNEIDGSSYSVNELIFPSELQLRKIMPLKLDGVGGIKWYRPIDLRHLLNLKSRYPDAKLVVGNTEVGIEMKLKNAQYKILIAATHVPELNTLKINNEGLEIGASVRLTELQQFLKLAISERKAHETSACKALLEQLKWFAGKQIKNVASVGGNICTASPISDLNPLWMASGATFQIINYEGTIRTVMSKNFFLGYRKVNLGKSEILLSVFLPWTRSFEFVKEFKQAHRRDDDIALVNSGMRVFLKENVDDYSVIDASIVFGGVGPVSLAASQTEAFLIGKVWNKKLLDDALHLLKDEISINADAPGGMIEFRKSLTLSFFFKFYLCVSDMIKESGSYGGNSLPMKYQSAIMPYYRPPSSGHQSYQSIKNGTAIGLSSVHLSAKLQVTGEAEYADDVPMPPHALHAALVLSTKAHARIISIDDSSAKSSQGYNGLFLSKDIPGCNRIGAILKDEDVFASEFVTCVGQIIGIVVADTHENARLAANKVHIEYDELPAVLSIQSAIQFGSYYPNNERCLVKGNVDLCFQSGACEKIIEGEVQVGGQEHFYLETNSTLVWTVDGGNEVHMISSTQNPRLHQESIAKVLNLPLSKVVCKTKRIGGGFGGKETRSVIIAAAACVPSYLLKRPVKITLDRDTDMMITGQRHSFLGKYKVGFTNSGMLMALDLQLFNNAGNSSDLSFSVLERAMFHSDNVYDIPNIRVLGNVCRTNFPSNTAFRGFGGPQGMLIAENWIQRVAMELHKSPEEIREINLQREGYESHYGQQLENCTLIKVWDELKESSQYLKVCEAVNIFNTQNRWKKRGISMIPTKFGISFTAKHMNQAGALVHVYLDGTVLVTHGGVEMGQGLHTKVAQVAASAFKIPLSSVFISETSTDKVPNASATAASASSDIYGGAVLDACEKIKSRMEPIASQKKYTSFSELVQACYMERIDLSAHGFYIIPDIGFDFKIGKGMPFNYYTYGAAFAEVEIDTLTGDFHTRMADIVMDLGHSINPAIDIGQIEGAFVQGMGWVALEEVKWGDEEHNWIKPGHLYTCGPGNYKLPSVNDIPLKFKVSLLKDVPNPRAIHSSKAVGEPPFFLSSAVLFAIKDAIIAARAEEGYKEWFPLDNPATPERIRMACVDDFTKPFASADYHPKLSI